jgi:hypothetical protein
MQRTAWFAGAAFALDEDRQSAAIREIADRGLSLAFDQNVSTIWASKTSG